jgi:hypothetical protein
LDTKRSVSIALPLHGGWTLEANCCTTGLGRGNTARFASQLIEKREIIRHPGLRVAPPERLVSTKTTSEHHVKENAVMSLEIEQLPDRQGYLKFASTPERRRVNHRPG